MIYIRGDIIIRELEASITVTNHGKTLFQTMTVPVIIDYGRTHVKIDGRNYGISLIIEETIEDEKLHIEPVGFWPHDVFLLLCGYYQFFSLDGKTARLELTIGEIKEVLNNPDEFFEDEDEELVAQLRAKIKTDEMQLKTIQRNWREETPEHKKFLKIIVELITYIYPMEKFNFNQIMMKLGKPLHLKPDSHNKSLKFDEFLKYALEILLYNTSKEEKNK